MVMLFFKRTDGSDWSEGGAFISADLEQVGHLAQVTAVIKPSKK